MTQRLVEAPKLYFLDTGLAAAVLGRPALGIEITAVGWLFGQAKLHPAPEAAVLARLAELAAVADDYRAELHHLPEFYHYCFAPDVLAFLLAAREHLDWRCAPADMTLMAFIAMYLHGKLPSALSNQLRGTKAMAPDYSVRWRRARGLTMPPSVDPCAFLRQRILWRYAHGRPRAGLGELWLGDSTELLPALHRQPAPSRYSLLFTSPPYWSVINYYTDQWLRNWLLGGPELPTGSPRKHERRFDSQPEYRALLTSVFTDCAALLAEDGMAYVRADAHPFTLTTTTSVLQAAFPGWTLQLCPSAAPGKTQTHLFNTVHAPPGEVDIILRSPAAQARANRP